METCDGEAGDVRLKLSSIRDRVLVCLAHPLTPVMTFTCGWVEELRLGEHYSNCREKYIIGYVRLYNIE